MSNLEQEVPTKPQGEQDTAWKAIHLLATINRLSLKANSTKTKQALIFLMLNDTINVIQYNRATLWTWEDQQVKLLGVSASANFNPLAEYVSNLKKTLKEVPNLEERQIVKPKLPEFILPGVSQSNSPSPKQPSILWLPISTEKNNKLGLLLERWETHEWLEDELEIIGFLMKNYATAWNHFTKHSLVNKLFNRPMAWISGLILAMILLIPISLPVSAPSEVVAKNPILISAPLEGVIKKIEVVPGQFVHKGDVLFDYDPQIPEQQFQGAKEEVNVTQAELNRAYILGMNNQEYLEQLSTLKYKLNKEKTVLELAKQRVDKLKVRATEDGFVEISEPEKWEGNPVKIGEKILTISNPKNSKVRIWIPEGDNFWINIDKPIKVLLNIAPEKTYSAKVNYLSSESSLNEQSIPSFVAEAEWLEGPNDPQLGLKGTATLYGPKVTIFYWLIRRPWTYVRHFTGL